MHFCTVYVQFPILAPFQSVAPAAGIALLDLFSAAIQQLVQSVVVPPPPHSSASPVPLADRATLDQLLAQLGQKEAQNCAQDEEDEEEDGEQEDEAVHGMKAVDGADEAEEAAVPGRAQSLQPEQQQPPLDLSMLKEGSGGAAELARFPPTSFCLPRHPQQQQLFMTHLGQPLPASHPAFAAVSVGSAQSKCQIYLFI